MVVVPVSGTATTDEDQTYMPLTGCEWVVKYHWAGVSVYPVPDKIPVPDTARKVADWKTICDVLSENVKLSGPGIDHSAESGVNELNCLGAALRVIDCPLGMVMNEPLAESALARLHVFTPLAAERFVVAMPPAS